MSAEPTPDGKVGLPVTADVDDTSGVDPPLGSLERLIRALALASSCAATACSKPEPGDPVHVRPLAAIEAPLEDPGTWCGELRRVRVCFAEACPGGVCVFPREPLAERELEYRCTGTGVARVCRLRRELASPFQCARGRCIQQYPRLPDDGEWECSELAGAVLCRGGQPPSGVVRAQKDAGWWCGERRGTRREQLCLDLDPDLPTGFAADWRCHFVRSGARSARVCEAGHVSRLGDECATEEDCPQGAQCVRNACIPRGRAPNCWKDSDCNAGNCELGLCTTDPR